MLTISALRSSPCERYRASSSGSYATGFEVEAREVDRARGAEVVEDRVLPPGAGNQGLPAAEVLQAVEVSARDAGAARSCDPGEELRAVEELEAVDEPPEPVRVGREAESRMRPGRRIDGVVGMRADERRPGRVGTLERRREAVRERHVLAQPDGDGMGRTPGIDLVVGKLEARDHEEAVAPEGARGLALDLGEVLAVRVGPDPTRAGRDHGVVLPVRVVAHAEDVEAGGAVELDELAHGKVAVAPRRVRVELGQQRRDLAVHLARMVARRPGARGGKVVAFQGERCGRAALEARVCSGAMGTGEGAHDVLVQEAEDAIA